LLNLVKLKIVDGWDDPRMPTISGIRRRGYSPESMKDFVSRVGVAKVESMVDYSLMEFCVREDLNKRAKRLMVILDPLKLVIDNYPEGKTEYFEAEDNPEAEHTASHQIPFGRELYIEREDFMEHPIKGYHRLYPGNEIRLKYAYYITATSMEKDKDGNITCVHCTYDPQSRGGATPDGRKIRGTSHWVAAKDAVDIEVRLYDKLFLTEYPGEKTGNYMDDLNPDSLKIVQAKGEPEVLKTKVGDYLQFVRNGYFCVDSRDSNPSHMVFNRTVTLKDSWAKLKDKMQNS
jgi:glutaminyl-tRNA synthetase